MQIAINQNGDRVNASSDERYNNCLCPVCGEQVIHKKGKINRPYFSHKINSNCVLSMDHDYKSEWHIRMQNYFKDNEIEVRFVDEVTGEIHIADVYVESKNTVIEFQHSPIDETEFLKRTSFHLNNGRRIVWVFDESKENVKENENGRFKLDDLFFGGWPYENLSYRWLRQPRKFLKDGPNIEKYSDRYSVCVYTGDSEECLHRIVAEECNFEYVMFSIHNIVIKGEIDVDDFFVSEINWLHSPPWDELFPIKRMINEEKRRQGMIVNEATSSSQKRIRRVSRNNFRF